MQDRVGGQAGIWEHAAPASCSWLYLGCYVELSRTSSLLGTCSVLQQVLCSECWWSTKCTNHTVKTQSSCPTLVLEKVRYVKFQFRFSNYWYVCVWTCFSGISVHLEFTHIWPLHIQFLLAQQTIYRSRKWLCLHSFSKAVNCFENESRNMLKM